MDYEQEQHRRGLAKVCRLCQGAIEKNHNRALSFKKEKYSTLIAKWLAIDVCADDENVYPPHICSRCERKLRSWRDRDKKKMLVKVSIDIKPFVQHSNDCLFCGPATLNLQALEQLASERGYTIVHEPDHSVLVDFDTANLRNRRCVDVQKNGSWKILIHGRMLDVKNCLALSAFPELLKNEDISGFIETVCQPICEGIKITEPLKGRRSFKGKSGEVVAMVENDTVIRHIRCKVFATSQCEICRVYGVNVKAMTRYAKSMKEKSSNSKTESSSHAPFSSLSEEDKIRRFKNVTKEKKRLKAKNLTLKRHVTHLMREDGVDVIQSQTEVFAKILDEAKDVPLNFPIGSPARLMYEHQIKLLSLKDRRKMRWHPAIMRLCMALHSKSPAAYKFLQESNVLVLPHINTINRYRHFTDVAPGINQDIMLHVANEMKIDSLKDHQRNVVLAIDEMNIKSGMSYNQKTGKIDGITELGDLNEELKSYRRSVETGGSAQPECATHVLVIMVMGIFTSHRLPIAYYPCRAMTGDQLFPVVWNAIEALEFIDLRVRAIIADGASNNRKFFKLHSVNPSKVDHKMTNPFAREREIFYFSDVPHLIKTTRNNWEKSWSSRTSRKLINKGKPIKWSHLVNVYEYDIGLDQNSPGLRILHKLKNEHIYLTPSSRMRVYLATQVLSNTTANALELLGDDESSSTVEFIRMFNRFFDCLNVANEHEGTRKRNPDLDPYRRSDDVRFQWLTDVFLKYINDWESQSTNVPKKGSKSKQCLSEQTLTGLRITVNSFVELSKLLLKLPGVEYILSRKFNQDPLEQYFSKQRGAGGHNTNPDIVQFSNNYLTLHASGSCIKAAKRGNSKREGEPSTSSIDETPLPKMKRK